MPSLGSEFPREQARCRELLTEYEKIGPAGAFGAAMIKKTLKDADDALASGSAIAMVRVFARMRDHE